MYNFIYIYIYKFISTGSPNSRTNGRNEDRWTSHCEQPMGMQMDRGTDALE